MKQLQILTAALLFSSAIFAQRNIKLVNLWAKPEVHVLFKGYKVSFTIKDINRALELLAESGPSVYGKTSHLDTLSHHYCELYPGLVTEYTSYLQPLMQKGVGVFLLLAGHAKIVSPRHRKVREIIGDIDPVKRDDSIAFVHFYDPRNNRMLFSGTMKVDMYNKDLGIN
jgi:hypothetical protein